MECYFAYTDVGVATRMSTESIEHLKGLLNRDKSFFGNTYSIKKVRLVPNNLLTLRVEILDTYEDYTV